MVAVDFCIFRQGIFKFLQKEFKKVISAIGIVAIGGICLDLPWTRSKRLEWKFGKKVPEFELKTLPYVSQKDFEEDLEFDILESVVTQAGVRIVWCVPGAGKTTTVKHVVNRLFDSNKIWKEKLALDSPIKESVVNYAAQAGTPMCLVRCVQLIGSNKYFEAVINPYVMSSEQSWLWGEKMLKSVFSPKSDITANKTK